MNDLNERLHQKRSLENRMRTARPSQLLLGIFAAGCFYGGVLQVEAQSVKTLYDPGEFLLSDGSLQETTNSDGADCYGQLVVADGVVYGTAALGGTAGSGTLFKINGDGTGFTVLYAFTAHDDQGFNFDGVGPLAGLTLSSNVLYGEARFGGNRFGTVFRLNTDGSDFTVLYSFYGQQDDSGPSGGLTVSGDTLYGTTENVGGSGGFPSRGSVFAIGTDGSNFRTLFSFTPLDPVSGTNDEGASPHAGLELSGNTLFGTTFVGGPGGNGTIFSLNVFGSGFNVLHSFSPTDSAGVNSDGARPRSRLILSGNVLYGACFEGGMFGGGTIYKLNTDGSGFSAIYHFPAASPSFVRDVAAARLALSGDTLYGTLDNTIYRINADGSDFATIYTFAGYSYLYVTNTGGAFPAPSLNLTGNTLYGTTLVGGIWGNGSIFKLLLPLPEISIAPTANGLELKWPTNSPGAILQTASKLGPSADWTAYSPPGVTTNYGQFVVTLPYGSSPSQQFFRLTQ